ncbi:MAG TPA: sigma-70 family RNA polymerase sigma factor [Vicinamibacterales bacterium]
MESSPIGDSSAYDRFEAFVREHQDMVFGTAVRLLGGRAEAEDVAQTVFLRAFQRFDRIGESPSAAGWLKTVTRNACLNHLARYRSRWRLFSELRREDTAGTAEIEDRAVESGRSPLEKLEQEETSRRLEDALRSLPDHQRVPLVLFHFERMSYQDIARALGVALAKLKTDMHRGRLALREVMK